MPGMDVLRALRRVWVDFGRRDVGFLPPRDAAVEPALTLRT